MPKINKKVVDALRPAPEGAESFAWDCELRGFGLRVMPSGVASYLVQYRTPTGRTRRFVIGRVGTLTPAEAREKARAILADASNGADPSAERHKMRNAITVGELCELYLEAASGRVKASTLAMDRSRIDVHVKPLIGPRPVTSLTTEDVEKLHADIAAGKTARPRRQNRGGVPTGGAGVAARTVGMLGTILEFAKRRKLIKANPTRGIIRARDGKQRRYLKLEEIAILGAALRTAESLGESGTALGAIRLLLMTGLRRMEGLALPWAWVDAQAGCIRFEDTKSGAQLRPIGGDVVRLLGSLVTPDTERNAGKGFWVFPADRGDGHFVGLPKVLARLSAKAGLQGVTVHVLRHSFAATAAELGYSELTIAGLLGHSVPGVTARYAHVPDAALKAAADRVSARIAAALDGRREESGLVVPLRRT
jgi:site-specific recombinase XerD